MRCVCVFEMSEPPILLARSRLTFLTANNNNVPTRSKWKRFCFSSNLTFACLTHHLDVRLLVNILAGEAENLNLKNIWRKILCFLHKLSHKCSLNDIVMQQQLQISADLQFYEKVIHTWAIDNVKNFKFDFFWNIYEFSNQRRQRS